MRVNVDDKKVLFIHIPKTGGMSIENVLLKVNTNGIKELKPCANMFYGVVNKGDKIPYQHLTSQQIFNDFKLDEVDNFDFIFTIVRDPYERVLSHINWRKVGIKVFFDNFEKDFNRIKNNGYNVQEDSHYLPQHKFIEGIEDRVKIYKFEQGFETIYKDLEKRLNKEIEYMHENPSNKTHTKEHLLPEYKQLVNKYYKEDFEKFDYIMEENI